ncbi:alginate lyase family protein [Streptomyces lavendulae]|uniref:alginate lyase family protein n=1 Tax=Streptomyces lavendulae TaxID=1914 RepID=UPI0033EE6025
MDMHASDDDARSRTFVHPGLLQSQELLLELLVKANATTEDSVMKTGYFSMIEERFASENYTHRPFEVVEVAAGGSTESEDHLRQDAAAAYAAALRWVKAGHRRHRDRAITILDDWAATFRDLEGPESFPEQTYLEAAWALPLWVYAAEIVRSYRGGNGSGEWPQASQEQFNSFIDRLYAHAEKADLFNNNWRASRGLAMLAVGVYQNDSSRYSAGKSEAMEMLPKLIQPSGEVHELKSKDCWHPQYSLTALVQAAEIMKNQNDKDSLYDLKIDQDALPRLALGLEYMAKSLEYGQGVRPCTHYRLLGGYGEISARYYTQKGVHLSTLHRAVKNRKNRPSKFANQFASWDTATHGSDAF